MEQSTFSWAELQKKYPPGATVENPLYVNAQSIRRSVTIVEITDDEIHFKWGVVRHGVISRENLETMAAFLAKGALSEVSDRYDYVDFYRDRVADEQPLVACMILADLGLLPT